MFPNLRAEMARKGLAVNEIAVRLGGSAKTLHRKLSGKSEFTRAEIFKIRNEFFPDLSIEYLFQTGRNQNTA